MLDLLKIDCWRLRVLLGMLSLFCSAAATSAPLKSNTWLMHPAHQGAPAFESKLTQIGEALQLKVRVLDNNSAIRSSNSFSQTDWAIQLWIADAAMVTVRKALLAESRDAIRQYVALKADADHQHDSCQSELSKFLGDAAKAQSAIANYDPFYQLLFLFDQDKIGAQSDRPLKRVQFALEQAVQPGKGQSGESGYFTATFAIAGHIDVQSLKVRALDYYLALVPIQSAAPRAVKASQLTAFNLQPEWDFQNRLARNAQLTMPLWANLQPIYLAQGADFPPNYLPANPSEVRGGACYGAEGHFSSPGQWQALAQLNPTPLLKLDTEKLTGWQLFSSGGSLLVSDQSVSAEKVSHLIDLNKLVGGKGNVHWQLLNGNVTNLTSYLLFRVEGESRPDSPTSYCGADFETDLLWLKLDRTGQLKNAQAHSLYSCFTNVTTLEEPGDTTSTAAKKSIWQWKLDVPPGRVAATVITGIVVLRYDPAHPELGIVVQPEKPQ